MKKPVIKILALFLILTAFFKVPGLSGETPGEKKDDKTVKFSWEAIDWAIRYEVQIKDMNNKIVLEKSVKTSSIRFSLPPGKYLIRIGVVNKFDRLLAWSDWTETEILKKKPQRVSSLNLGIKILAGIPYYQFLDTWGGPFENSYRGFIGKIGFNFGNFILFRPSNRIKYTGIFSYFGLEVEGSYMRFKGKEIHNVAKIDKSEYTIGGNLYFRTNFSKPVNFILRGGGGVASAEFRYYTRNGNFILKSNDPYYKAGLSIELSIFSSIIIEGGAEFMEYRYIDDRLRAIRYIMLFGVRL